jgi:hypothetical protein
MRGLLTNNELERIWKEAAMAEFTILSEICVEGPSKFTKNLSYGSQSAGRHVDLGPQ